MESYSIGKFDNGNGEYTQGYDAKIRKNNVVTPSATDLVGGISSISFDYLSPGFYALINEAETEKYIIKIKNSILP